LVNVLRAIHKLVYSGAELEATDLENSKLQPGKGSPTWLDNFWDTGDDDDKN
jgi:hypothetical protein